MEKWSDGVMRKNRNRGYQKLTVWKDAIEYYFLTCDVFRSFPYGLTIWLSKKAMQLMETINPTLQRSSTPTLQYSNTPVLRGNVSGMPGPPTDCDEEIT